MKPVFFYLGIAAALSLSATIVTTLTVASAPQGAVAQNDRTRRIATSRVHHDLSPVASTKGNPCPLPIPNGQVLQQSWGVLRVDHGNILRIANRSGQNAIVKARDPILGRTRLSVFVGAYKTASYNAMPDGSYIVDYALGRELDAACITFLHLARAGQIGYLAWRSADSENPPAHHVVDIVIPSAGDLDADRDTISADAFNFD